MIFNVSKVLRHDKYYNIFFYIDYLKNKHLKT